jgi:hypothetical protein
MLETNKYKLTEKEKLMNITLDATQQKELKKMLKCGIYKELYKRDILSDVQLNCLLKKEDTPNDK